MSFRDPNLDRLKEGQHLINARKTRCSVTGCENFLTAYQGPGSDKFCRQHQREQHEYGGLAKGVKEHSFGRKDQCDACGFKPDEDDRFTSITDAKVRNAAIRSVLDVDHIDGNHSNNDPDNLQTLCKICHGVKTIVNADYQRKS